MADVKELAERVRSAAVELGYLELDMGGVPALDKVVIELDDVWGELCDPDGLSDGYHTFDELYHHRAVLFSVIVSEHKGIAWKSKLHDDGTMYDDMLIVGVNTPHGQAAYHYNIDPYWDIFDCVELPNAPAWDGHTPAEAIERIGGLR